LGAGEAVKEGDVFAVALCDALLALSDVDRYDTIDPNGVYHIIGSTVEG